MPGFKFGKYHHFQEVGHPDRLIVDEGEPRAEDEAMLRDFASRYFPDGTGPTMTLAACMFTNTPDGHFIIDQHPQHPQIVYASPCSGHGYKFASVIGEVMAELADLGSTRWDISLFRADRFGVPTSALFRDRGPAPHVPIGGHDPFGRNLLSQRPGRGPGTGRSAAPKGSSVEDTRDPRYWQRDEVTPFW